MKYSPEIVRRAEEVLESRRAAAQESYDRMINAARRADIRFIEIEKEMSDISAELAKSVLQREGRSAVLRAKDKIDTLTKERDLLLTTHGLSKETYKVQYFCKLCYDSGAKDGGGPCECYLAILKNQIYKSSVLASALSSQRFDSFELSAYSDTPGLQGVSPRLMAKKNLEICKNFVANFERQGLGLLMTGATGLGKTHLSSAIAKEIAGGGYSVQYDMAGNILRRLEDRRFGRTSEIDPDAYSECDLLIIDDLGSEYMGPVTMSELFTLINTRLITGKKTIISTNYTLNELSQNYTQKFVSRLLDGYTILHFAGEDMRSKRRQKG